MGNIINFFINLLRKNNFDDYLKKKHYDEQYFQDLEDSHVVYVIFVGFLSGEKLVKNNTGTYVIKFGKSENFQKRIRDHRKRFDAYCNVINIHTTISATQAELYIKREMRKRNKLLKLSKYGTELLTFRTESEFNDILGFIKNSVTEIKNKQHRKQDVYDSIRPIWL